MSKFYYAICTLVIHFELKGQDFKSTVRKYLSYHKKCTSLNSVLDQEPLGSVTFGLPDSDPL